jgi:hypothetical protein
MSVKLGWGIRRQVMRIPFVWNKMPLIRNRFPTCGRNVLTSYSVVECNTMRDFGLPPRSSWDLRSFGNFTQREMIVSYRRFGITYRSHLKGSSLGQTVCPETSVTNYHSALRKILKERRSHEASMFSRTVGNWLHSDAGSYPVSLVSHTDAKTWKLAKQRIFDNERHCQM